MTASGSSTPDPGYGLREFVVGTGGASHYALGAPLPSHGGAERQHLRRHEAHLRAGSYDWQFIPEAGKTFTDRGTGTCHGAPAAP